jgi:hypothetical protein
MPTVSHAPNTIRSVLIGRMKLRGGEKEFLGKENLMV